MIDNTNNNKNLLAWYKFDNELNVGKDSSGNDNHGKALGSLFPTIGKVKGRKAAQFSGGSHGTSYIELPENILAEVSDFTGITISTWINLDKGTSVWERIFDFGNGSSEPYMFLTRNLRGICHSNDDLVADPGKSLPTNQWVHIAFTVVGTKGGTLSSAGPIIYINGEISADGSFSQTSSGTYAKLRSWFHTFNDSANYSKNYIGLSQYNVDEDFCGSLSDFRIYKDNLTVDNIIEVMCESLTDIEILKLAKDKYLSFPWTIITEDIPLPSALMGDKVTVAWSSSHESILTSKGKIGEVSKPEGITINATLTKGSETLTQSFNVSVLPKDLPPYTITIDGGKDILPISRTLYGLFYEDINNAADGGIYSELINNRSFEAFTYDTYDSRSGENAVSTGRNRNPLLGWYGDLDLISVENKGGLNEFLSIADPDTNNYYITVPNCATIYNPGFSDTNGNCSMFIRQGEQYDFTIWAKSLEQSSITIELIDRNGTIYSDKQTISIAKGNKWSKYGVTSAISLTGLKTGLAGLSLSFNGFVSIDMVSLMPRNVWGATSEPTSKTAHKNYLGNPNYRLRKDLVESLMDLRPTFLRFPGGCISEGSYIWENIYDWKESVGPVETRKENFNVWGYMMTMGLGYMEYFQLAEDLNATPMPVMACGVLCQARSDYANPAGGSLQEKYIKNFTDLIDFSINTNTRDNAFAKLRKEMGHEAPFDLHYLGVGNENWGPEFFASFEIFKTAIDKHMEENYPGYELHIISTVGAQADDDAYQEGWKFISGNLEGTANVSFTDGVTSTNETVSWYNRQPNYMETIVDEHYYRSNEYLLENVDRYNYYYRSYNQDGSINDKDSSKVFVGEYASTDKNTLAGAIAEAAIMTGFENNSDVVRLAATAPLFNKVLTDGTYRWTPDAIWFDDETVWHTPNYYIQQLFAQNLGTTLLGTTFETYNNGNKVKLIPQGGIEIATGNAVIHIKEIKVISNTDGSVLFEQDFRMPLKSEWNIIEGSAGYKLDKTKGLILSSQENGLNGLSIINPSWTNYSVKAKMTKIEGTDGFFIAAGVTNSEIDKKNALVYAIGYNNTSTGVKVFKDGIEAYTLGDYSSSSAAGNLRSSCYEELKIGSEYTVSVNYGGDDKKSLKCSYTDGIFTSKNLHYKLEAYNREVFHSVTKDQNHIYAKLVNADSINKIVAIKIDNITTNKNVRYYELSGDDALLHQPNVNQKDNEKIISVEGTLYMKDQALVVELKANSCMVLILDRFS